MYDDIAAVSSTSDAAVTLAHEPAPARKRRRPAVVCVQCRRRKVGCDRKKPCAQCIQYKSICTYERGSYEPVVAPTVVKTPADNDSHSTTSSSILQTAALNSTGPSPRRTGTTRISRSASGSASRRSGLVSSPEDVCTPGNAASARIQGKERASRLAIRSSTVQTSVQQYDRENRNKVSGAGHGLSIPAESQSIRNHSSLDPFNGRARFAKSRYFGNSHMGNSMAPFDKIVRSSFHAVYDKGSDANILLEKCKQAARVIKARRPIPQSILMDLRLYVPQRDKCDELVRSYLQTFETVFRVLHTPTFQCQYIRFWEQPEAAEEVFIVKLLLVMSIGSVFRRDLDAVGNFYHFESWSWLYAAQLWLGAPNDKSRLGVDGVQIQCLILLSLQVNGVGADLTCITAGSLVRAAMTIGLHRDPGNFSGMSVMESEVRRRLWATVMEITIQSSLDLGMPPLISQDDFDCEPPRNLDDDQFDETTTTAPIARGLDTFTQSSILCALSRTQSIRLRIVKSLNSVHSDLSYDEAVRWGQELTSACRSNSTLFEYFISSKQPGKGEPSPFQIKLVDVLIRRFILSLHTPFAHRTDVNLAYYFSRKVCVESSLLLLAYSIKSPSTSSRSEEDDYRRLEIFGRGLFKMVFILSAATVIFELTRELQEDSSPSTSTLSRSDLYRSAREIVELSWRRIGAGETSVIGYVYFACALSQIQALQSGNHASTDYSNVAKKTLQECYEILGPAAARHASMDTAESYDWQAEKFPGGEINSAADINPSFQDASLQLDTSTPWTFYGWGTWDTDDMLTSS